MSLFAELKRRRVFRAGLVYLVVAWAVIQVADVVMPRLGVPGWGVTLVIILAALGLPIALVLAWLYDVTPEGVRTAGDNGNNRRALGYLGIGIVIALVGLGAYMRYGLRDDRVDQNGNRGGAASIAVLPFVNMSADENQEYFSDGLTEELLSALSQLPALRVAARTSAFSFKGKNVPVAEIARALNVNTVLEGSVRKAGNRVRITAQLINATDGYHLWSQTFDRELTDVFAIQEEISRAIVDALELRLAPRDSASLVRDEHDLEAYNLYLQARFFWNRRTESNLIRARELLERAIELDPNFARAHAALADVYAVWNDYSTRHDHTAIDNGERAARRALALEPTLAEAHNALAAAYQRSFRWGDAEAAYRRAIELKPSYATAHQWYSWHLLYTRNGEAALAEINAALALDPLSLIINENKAEHLLFLRRYDEAIAQLQHTLRLDSTFAVPFPALAMVYSLKGDHANAMRYAERSLAPGAERNGYALGHSAAAFARAGQRDRARQLVREMEQRSLWPSAAPAYVVLGDTAKAIAALERAYREGADLLLVEVLAVNEFTTPIREHPRVKELIRKIGLAP